MQEEEPKDNNQRPGGGEGGFNWKGLVLLFVAMGLFGLAIWSKSFSDSSKSLTIAEFKQLVENGKIKVDENAEPPKILRLVQKDGSSKQFVTGWYEVEDPEENGGDKYKLKRKRRKSSKDI